MATTLKTKNSVTTTVTPTTLAQGELAVNITDKKMWVGNAATTPVQILGAGATNRAGGSNTQVQYNSSGDLAGSANFVFDGSTLTTLNSAYTGTLTGGTGVVNLGSGQFYKDASGNVGIGTSSIPAWSGRALQIASRTSLAAVGTTDVQVTNNGFWTGSQWSYIASAAASNYYQDAGTAPHVWRYAASGTAGNAITWSEAMRIDSSGNLLVNTTTVSDQGKVTVAFNGTGNQGLNLQETANQASAGFMYFNYSTTVLGTITRNGATNAVNYNTTSDVRLKENITDAKPALKTVSDIKVRQYDWIGTDCHQDYGFIAQELAEVVSDVVTKGRTEDDTWAVDYGKLTPILVKAIQEQQALIENLTTRLNALEGK